MNIYSQYIRSEVLNVGVNHTSDNDNDMQDKKIDSAVLN